ncbi:calcium-dependent phosphotriesterase [Hortaea werneckii]|nr:calcium-dependent phosphotriesterase [Hortaea werneckii]
MSEPGGIVKMSPAPPYKASTLVDGFLGRQFNSVNDLVVHQDGSIWFTDPMYGWEQGFRPKPRLPCQVYRFDPESGDIRVVADGFGRPNGLCFSPDEKIMYITDTDIIHGDGNFDETRPGTIYAFDVSFHSGSPFLSNRRVFAMAARGAPDGIKCDTQGNVYSGCGDGVNVWGPSGTLLGKIEIPGGVANFCFTRKGEMILLNEKKNSYGWRRPGSDSEANVKEIMPTKYRQSSMKSFLLHACGFAMNFPSTPLSSAQVSEPTSSTQALARTPSSQPYCIERRREKGLLTNTRTISQLGFWQINVITLRPIYPEPAVHIIAIALAIADRKIDSDAVEVSPSHIGTCKNANFGPRVVTSAGLASIGAMLERERKMTSLVCMLSYTIRSMVDHWSVLRYVQPDDVVWVK